MEMARQNLRRIPQLLDGIVPFEAAPIRRGAVEVCDYLRSLRDVELSFTS